MPFRDRIKLSKYNLPKNAIVKAARVVGITRLGSDGVDHIIISTARYVENLVRISIFAALQEGKISLKKKHLAKSVQVIHDSCK